MKPISELTMIEVNELAKLSVSQRCARIIDEFDEWLAVRVLRLKLASADLPQLNDVFRVYFTDTRTVHSSEGARKTALRQGEKLHPEDETQ